MDAKKITAIATAFAVLLGILGTLGYLQMVKQEIGTGYNMNKTVLIDAKIIDGIAQLNSSIVLCGYGKKLSGNVLLIDYVDVCDDSKINVATIVQRDSCEIAQEDFNYLYDDKFLGVMCDEKVRIKLSFYDLQSLQVPYQISTDGRI